MREETNVEYRWSAAFWLKKALWLLGMFLTGWLIWWLWNYTADDVDTSNNNDTNLTVVDTDSDGTPDSEDTDDDGDNYSDVAERNAGTDPLDANEYPTDSDNDDDGADPDGDGYTNAQEAEAGSDPDDVSSTPETVQGPATSDNSPFSVTIPGFTGEPTVSSNGTSDCVYTYDYGNASTLTVYDSCLPLDGGNTDWVWTHDSNANVTNSPSAYDCSGPTAVGNVCTHGNGILEVWSLDAATQDSVSSGAGLPAEFVAFYFSDQDGANENNFNTTIKPIIESFSRN